MNDNIIYDNKNGKVIFNIPCASRYAPTVYYNMHIGHAWIAYFTYVTTKENNGKFIARFDDIFQGEIYPEARKIAEDHIKGLEWLGIIPDEVIWMSDILSNIKDIIRERTNTDVDYQDWFVDIKELGVYRFFNKDIMALRSGFQLYEPIYSAAADMLLNINYIVRGEDLLYISALNLFAFKWLKMDLKNMFFSYIPVVRCEGARISKSNPFSDKLFLYYLREKGMTGEELISLLRKVCLQDSNGPISYTNLNFYPNFSISELP